MNNPAIVFLACSSLILAWFVGFRWGKAEGKGIETVGPLAGPMTVVGGAATVICLLISLIKMILHQLSL